jgi:hypothetical protein
MYTLKIVRSFRNVQVTKYQCYTNVTKILNENHKIETEINEKPGKFYDIVICGGGMVGVAMASALGN